MSSLMPVLDLTTDVATTGALTKNLVAAGAENFIATLSDDGTNKVTLGAAGTVYISGSAAIT
eukprot:scaffold543_cov243-Alexandrium_tamarense.AAC.8